MKRCFFTILLAYLVFSCFAIPAFIRDNQVTPTPEQKAEYERKVRERPDAYSYYPLQVGNKWWRILSDGSHQLVKEVVDSTWINNHVYYKVIGLFGVGQNQWIRNEGDLSLVYDEFDLDNNPNTTDLIHEDFSRTGYYTVYRFVDIMTGLWNCFSDGEHYLSHYWIPTYLRFHEYRYPNTCFGWETRGWARGFGMTYSEGEDYLISIGACRINGIHYGATVSVADDTSPQSSLISLDCYPNPFKTETTVSYNLAEKSDVKLEIYNLKGQRIKTLIAGTQSKGRHSVVWNGTDDNGRPVSSGMYFCKLVTSGKVLTNKMVLMR